MDITRVNLDNLYTGFSARFNGALLGYTPRWERVAMLAPSTTAQNQYAWLGQMKGMREWVGDRHIAALARDGYKIENLPFENTVRVKRTDIEDDNYGTYSPMFADLGQTAAEQPDLLVYGLLAGAFTTECYDGQYFVDTDHPVLAADGSSTTYSNSGGGSGTPWFLMCTKKAVKPLIFQDRKKPNLVRKDKEDDDNTFLAGDFVYGVDMRCNAGFGLPQLVYGSKQELNAENYEAARASIMTRVGSHGRKLNLVPDLLVVPSALEGRARRLLKNELIPTGGTNEWFGTAELHVEPLL